MLDEAILYALRATTGKPWLSDLDSSELQNLERNKIRVSIKVHVFDDGKNFRLSSCWGLTICREKRVCWLRDSQIFYIRKDRKLNPTY